MYPGEEVFRERERGSRNTATTFIWMELYELLQPGGSAIALPVIWDKYDKDATETYLAILTAADAKKVYDPHYQCLAFGAGANTKGERVRVTFDRYRGIYEVAGPSGLTRVAELSASLSPGGSAAATIQATDHNGMALGTHSITVYNAHTSGDALGSGKVMAHYISSERKWYTWAYNDTT